MVKTAIQLYTLRAFPGSFTDVLKAVAEAGFDGVEFAYRVTDADPSRVAATLDELDLEIAGAHVPFDTLTNDYEETTARYEQLDCTRLVVPAYDADRFQSRDAVDAVADDLTSLGTRLAADGFDLAYHNHGHEFVELGSDTAYEVLANATGGVVDFEFDTGLAYHVGAEPSRLLRELAGRVPLVHLTNTVVGDDTQVHATYGMGDLDVGTAGEAAIDAGAHWLVYENGVTDDQPAELEHAASTFVPRWG